MGTNYFISYNDVCEHCRRGANDMHIGKSSMGWCFSLRVYPDEGIKTLDDWKRVMSSGGRIRDEYNREISAEDMLSIIADRKREPKWDQKPYGYSSWDEFHDRNHSEPGPDGMLRHQVDGRHCVGHGAGSYDYIIGEFS